MSRSLTGGRPANIHRQFTEAERRMGKLLFTKLREKSCALLLSEDKLTAVQVLPDTASKIGAIYIGKVKNVAKNIDACFVEIGDGDICFLPFKETTGALLLNRTSDGRILAGDELVVQITRDAQKTKQPTVTAHISLSNEAFVISLGNTRIGFSEKLSTEKKTALRQTLECNGILQAGRLQPASLSSAGLVVRTLAENLSEAELLSSFQSLSGRFEALLNSAKHKVCFSCLQEAPAAFEAVLEQLVYPYEYEEIITDDAVSYKQLSAYCDRFLPDKRVRFYEDDMFSLAKLYSLESRLEEALVPRVWLKSGGYLVIEPTEALTVIDVNSGKFENKKTSRETYFKVNQEAAEEIARQLRLRNLSGMILVDFINMNSPEQDNAILELLRRLVRQDKQKTIVVDMTPLGLVEITRKKGKPPLREQLQEK